MFTGIIEAMGEVEKIDKAGSNFNFLIGSDISPELKIDQSVSHNGVCLTVTKLETGKHWVTAIDETMQRTNLGFLQVGNRINLERCMRADGRYDGHIVQGHVDTTALVAGIQEMDGSWLYDFRLEESTELLVDKGSVTVNGTSLTCFHTSSMGFRVAIIPYTYAHTNFHQLNVGDRVNIEFDILGKYVQKMLLSRKLN